MVTEQCAAHLLAGPNTLRAQGLPSGPEWGREAASSSGRPPKAGKVRTLFGC